MYVVNKAKTEPQNDIKIYDLIISIGEACSCTQCLRLLKLQNFSYPFDWLCGSSFQKRIDIITSDFKDFINKEDLVFSHSEEAISRNAYKNTSNGLVFNHDFLNTIPFDEAYEEVREKYDRRSSRLLDKIRTSSKVLFIYMSLPNSPTPLDINEILVNAQGRLAKAFPTTKCDILYISHAPELPLKQYNYENISERILKVSLFNKSLKPDDGEHVVNIENVIQVFSKYFLTP